MVDATALREKQAAAYAAEKADSIGNIASMKSAVAALEKGMAGDFLQTDAAQLLKKLAFLNQSRHEGDLKELLAFLRNGQSANCAPQSGEMAGIVKTMKAQLKAIKSNLEGLNERNKF